MSNQLYILSGVSGSGKSTYVKSLTIPNLVVCSADHYFLKGGTYKFSSNQLGVAHEFALSNARVAMDQKKPVLVDDTNVRFKDITKYLQLASMYGYTVEFTIFEVPKEKISILAGRNVHGVLEDKIKSQWDRQEYMRKHLKKDMKSRFPELTFKIIVKKAF